MAEFILVVGRILFGLIFVGSGIAHFRDPGPVANLARMRGLPINDPLTRLAGLAMLAGGLGVILGFLPDLALIGLILFLLITAFSVHSFWRLEGELRHVEMAMFMKNISLTGGALGLLAFTLLEDADHFGFQILGPLL